jgi:hypothetical protein
MGNRTENKPVTNITNVTQNSYTTGTNAVGTALQAMGYRGRWLKQFERSFNKTYGKAAKMLQEKYKGRLMHSANYVIGVGPQV